MSRQPLPASPAATLSDEFIRYDKRMFNFHMRLRRSAHAGDLPTEPRDPLHDDGGQGARERHPVPDYVITTRVAEAIKVLPRDSTIEVSVFDGIVTLTGVVRDRKSKYQAEYLVSQIQGVVDVENLLRIRTAEYPASNDPV